MSGSESILVTGGAGFVGSALVRRLLAHIPGSPLVIVDSLANGHREFLPTDGRVDLRQVDLRDGEALRSIVAETRPGLAFHLAAHHFIPFCNAHPTETIDVNVRGTQQLLDVLKEFPPRAVLIASTAAVYPIWDEPCSEASLAPAPTDIYGLTKWFNERQLALYSQQAPSRCVAARLFNVYGPRETNPHVLPEIIVQLVEGRDALDLGNIKPKRDYIHSDDIASALVALAEAPTAKFDVFNVGTGSEYSVEELVEQLSRIIDRPIGIRTDPARVRASDRMHLVADSSKLRRLTGWAPRYELSEGLRELWVWSVENLSGAAR